MTECADLATRHDFSKYISLLLQNGSVDADLVERCRPQVCTALWGQGNPDISGIGMIVGYALEHGIGVFLASIVLITAQFQRQQKLQARCIRLLAVFHDCAAFLCLSIQIAAVVVLVKEATGISTTGMGDGSVRVTEAVSVSTLLPLAYAVVLASPLSTTVPRSASAGDQQFHPKTTGRNEDKRFALLVVCWVLAFYPFYSKMNNVFGPTKISDSPGSPIALEQFAVIEGICFRDVASITSSEDALMSALAILAYIPLSLFIIGRIIVLGIRKHHEESRLYIKMHSMRQGRLGKWIRVSATGCLGLIPVLACGLLWTIIRVVQFQNDLGQGVGAVDADQQWTFGQVVAVLLFTPVLVECWMLVGEKGDGVLAEDVATPSLHSPREPKTSTFNHTA